MRERLVQMGEAVVELRRVARELLPERERRGVLQMGAADLDDIAECRRLRRECVAQQSHRRLELLFDRQHGGDVHGGRECVVRRLTTVHVVVGMHEPFLAALAAENFRGAVAEHLVHVHVGLGARPGLPHDQRELVIVLARERLVGSGDDRLALGPVEHAERHVHRCRRALHHDLRAHELDRHGLAGKVEVVQAALGLGTPQFVDGHLDVAHGVALDPYTHVSSLLSPVRRCSLTRVTARGPVKAAYLTNCGWIRFSNENTSSHFSWVRSFFSSTAIWWIDLFSR